MNFTLFRTKTFESAHKLPKVPENHKCHNTHGHSFEVTVYMTGELDPTLGWVCDFSDLDYHLALIHAEIDHKFLNDIKGLENPTSENLALWVFNKLRSEATLKGEITRVEVRETSRGGCVLEV